MLPPPCALPLCDVLSPPVQGEELGAAGERGRALDALKWGTDWLLKTTATPNTIYAQVG